MELDLGETRVENCRCNHTRRRGLDGSVFWRFCRARADKEVFSHTRTMIMTTIADIRGAARNEGRVAAISPPDDAPVRTQIAVEGMVRVT